MRAIIPLLTAVLCTGCATDEDLQAWEEMQEGAFDALPIAPQPVPQDYDCTYKCDEVPKGPHTATVNQTSSGAAAGEIIANADNNGDGINDYCDPGDVVRGSVKCELAP